MAQSCSSVPPPALGNRRRISLARHKRNAQNQSLSVTPVHSGQPVLIADGKADINADLPAFFKRYDFPDIFLIYS